jgi:hypothetical protein
MITVVKTRIDCTMTHRHLGTATCTCYEWWSALIAVTKFLFCTAALCFTEALLSLGRLYLRIQPVAASMKYLIQFMLYDQPWVSGVVAVFLHLIYNTAINNVSEPSLLPISLSPAISDENETIPLISPIGPQPVRTPECGRHVSKREEYNYQWRDIHDAPGRFPFTPGRKRWQEM